MGFLDGITQESKRNFIARPDAAKEDIIYLYPEHNIRLMTQLTLMPEEVAIFINEGRAQGKLGPGGTHVLDTKNVPFISRLLEKLTGGNLFIAQLFFITTGKPFVGIKFGGSIGALRDPVNDYTVAGMVSANTAGGGTLNFTDWRTIKCVIEGETYYLVAAKTIA